MSAAGRRRPERLISMTLNDCHPFCLTGDEWPGLSNCRFDTYAQCQASASGRALTCIANPYFVGQSDDPYAYQNRPRAQTPGYSPGYFLR